MKDALYITFPLTMVYSINGERKREREKSEGEGKKKGKGGGKNYNVGGSPFSNPPS